MNTQLQASAPARILRIGVVLAVASVLVPPLIGATKTHTAAANGSGGNIWSTDGSQADVQSAIQSAVDGDIIKVPAGTFTWGAASPLFVSKAITLAGAGMSGAPTGTTIQIADTGATAGAGSIQISAGGAIVRDIKVLQSTGGQPTTAFSTSGTNGWRITNVAYDNHLGTSSGYFVYGANYGLIDHCNITANGDELIFTRGPLDSWQTTSTWGTDQAIYVEDCTFNGPGYVSDFNSNSRAVVRYCTITGQMKIDSHGLASNQPPRSVRYVEVYNNHWTYNTNGAFPEIELRGGSAMVFDNVSDMSNVGLAWYEITDYGFGGFVDNFSIPIASAAPGGATTTITTTVPHGLLTGAPVYVKVFNSNPNIGGRYLVTVTGTTTFTIPVAITTGGNNGIVDIQRTPLNYPIPDQVGVGIDPLKEASEPLYSWGNMQNGAIWKRQLKPIEADALLLYTVLTGKPSFKEDDLIKPDRDVYLDETVTTAFDGSTGVGVGTKAQMLLIHPPASNSVPKFPDGTDNPNRVGYWVTDEGSWNTKVPAGTSGQLYTWDPTANSGAGGWILKYTPYTYPHPLQSPKRPLNPRLN